MDLKEVFKKRINELSKIGEIITVLNLIEQNIVIAITHFFSDFRKLGQERTILLNDILWDRDIFATFEQKRKLLIKIIKRVERIAKEKGVSFSSKKYLEICASIKGVGETRNKIAHNYLCYDRNGCAVYIKRKSDSKRLEDKSKGIKGSIERIKIDLDEELKKSIQVYKKSEILLIDVQSQIRKVLQN